MVQPNVHPVSVMMWNAFLTVDWNKKAMCYPCFPWQENGYEASIL